MLSTAPEAGIKGNQGKGKQYKNRILTLPLEEIQI